ncbi:TPA: hypothetical protein GF680_21090 [Escherichia coli]|uniref:hypothetical protein n=1 Tax=Escherichia coli TaxID=562 RepID=UPI000B42C140|nr:hypothetical protein [Escherichia coli]OWC50620.1 hypothetical protein A8F90_18920 [Escherichia coli]RCR29091.1 hypothetical protein APT28_23080 [Escherichia coli]HAH2757911.1 hypothetical protein [Escherichia coli]HAM4598258.1 hypothetical protein [Escherichia coli]
MISMFVLVGSLCLTSQEGQNVCRPEALLTFKSAEQCMSGMNNVVSGKLSRIAPSLSAKEIIEKYHLRCTEAPLVTERELQDELK